MKAKFDLNEKKRPRLLRLNKIFLKKIEKDNEICFLHKWFVEENHKGNILSIEQFIEKFKQENPFFKRITIYSWIDWLITFKFIIKKKEAQEFMLSEVYLECLKQNALQIYKMCNEFEEREK